MSEREQASDEERRVDGPDAEQQRARDPEEIRRDIEQTREELGDTVDAIAHKADVKARGRDEVEQRKQQLRDKQEEARAKLGEVRERATEVTPEQAQEAVAGAGRRAAENPLPVVAAGAFVAGLVIGRLTGRRR